MCGIAGFIAQPGRGKSSSAVSVLQSLKHRGPDDLGWLRLYASGEVESGREWKRPSSEPTVLLLHRRLAILDTSECGWQPMGTPDGRYHVVFNGEIYNYMELREELENLGYIFRSHSDTEVLLAAYAEWGGDAFRRFVGMFAFALLDVRRKKVLLVRDFFGIKPLYYCAHDGCICFGSEIKALKTFGLAHSEANTDRLYLYLRYGLTDFGDETMLSAVKQVPVASYIEITIDSCAANQPQRYWERDSGGDLDISFEEAAEHLRGLFLRSVELHLRSDVPLGAALSGGIDSTSIVMAIRHLQGNADIHAFSYISEDSSTSEERWVDIAGQSSKAHIHKVRATPEELFENMNEIMHFHDEPFGSTSIYAQYRVFKAAKAAGITVMLDGQGADEILAGYPWYLGARIASLVRQGHWREAILALQKFSHVDGFSRFKGVAHCADYLLPPPAQKIARRLAGKDSFPASLNSRWFAERGTKPAFLNYNVAQDVLKYSLDFSVKNTLPGLLRYEDRDSMAFSVESRVPFLTPDLVSFMGRLPENYIIDENGTTKAVFRRAMRGLVPDAILDRRDKIGFATPERRWLNALDSWVSMTLNSSEAHQIPFLNIKAARAQWKHVRGGKRSFNSQIWLWLSIIRWTESKGITFE